MHQPDGQPRQSLYHRYTVHPAWRPPSGGRPPEVPVVVVGAGPIGLATALDLARHGVHCVLLSADLQVCEGSRAIVFTRRSMEILQQLGVDRAVTAAGLPWRFGNSFYRGQAVYRLAAPHGDDERFHPMTNLQQQLLEQVMVDAVARQPLVELRWGGRLSGILRNDPAGQVDGGIELSIDTPTGPYTQRARWLVACDGARSTVRQLLDLRLEGASYEGRFVIADIRVDLPFPTERRAYFDPDWNPGNTVLMHRQPHGMWRIDYQLPPGETPEQALAPESLRARIDAQLAMVGHAGAPWQLDWCSVYSARAMTLPALLHHRVALAGDAAHLLPIFGVRGANTGFQDAHNLGWKLALVARGAAGPALLESYSQERVAAAREIIDEAGKSTRFMTPPSRGHRLLRDAVLSLSVSQPFVGPLFHWRTSRPHDHRDSSLNSADDEAGFTTGPSPGMPLPNHRLGPDDHLLDHFGPAFWLLCWPGPTGLAPALQAVMEAWRQRGVPLRCIAMLTGGPASTVSGAAPGAAAVPSADVRLHDADGRLAARLGVADPAGARGTAAYLVRPDQHVCARWQAVDAARLDRALHRALARPQPADPLPRPTPPMRAAAPPVATAPAAPDAKAPTATTAAPAAPGADGLSLDALERVYDALAQAIDQAGAAHSERLLAKLALLLAQRVGDGDAVAQAVGQALQDL